MPECPREGSRTTQSTTYTLIGSLYRQSGAMKVEVERPMRQEGSQELTDVSRKEEHSRWTLTVSRKRLTAVSLSLSPLLTLTCS